MEDNNTPSSSFTNDLFGSKESAAPPASTGIFSLIFPPPSKVMGSKCSIAELMDFIQRHSVGSQVWNKGTPEDLTKNNDEARHCIFNKERSSIFQERAEPCPLSSSLYYGGQEDMYMLSSHAQSLGSYPDQFKKDWEEDGQKGNNSHTASRGNWWQGSLYY